MQRKDLKNKPLIEAILELKWALQAPLTMEGDPHYRLLLGRFSEKVESDYPFHEQLPTAQIPDVMTAHMVQHRFRTGDGKWPLVQIGPGILTVNETDRYTWSKFKERCIRAVENLVSAHPAKQDFAVQGLTLRYIDAVEVDFSRETVFEFLKGQMKTKIELPESLFRNGGPAPNPTAFNWQASFRHDDPGGLVTLRFGMGQKQGNPALVWETLVEAAHERLPEIPGEFTEWLDKAHALTDDWFFKLIEGDLERRFSGE